MISVVFYQFEKRTNSTKLPDVSGVTFNCEINANCSMVSPRIEINYVGTGGAGNPTLYNYCYISDFTRYYFVRNWTWAPGKWIADLSEDVLASYRTQIGNASEYVARSSNTYDGTLIDTLYPTKAGSTYNKVPGASQWVSNIESGVYILSTVCSGWSGFGATTYWAMDAAAFQSFRNAMLSSTDYLNISSEEISNDLTKALLNPYQYCISAYWVPMSGAFWGGSTTNQVAFGWWNVNISSGNVNVIGNTDNVAGFRQSFSVPKNPQAQSRGSFTNCAPYTTYKLFYPPFGEIEIDGQKIGDATTIWVAVRVDAYTGQGWIYVSTDEPPATGTEAQAQNIIAMASAQVGVPISLAQISYNTVDSLGELVSVGIQGVYGAVKGLVDSASHIGGAVSSALSGDYGGALDELGQVGSTTANNVGDAMQHELSEVAYKGSCGSVAFYQQAPYLLARFHTLADDDNEHRGRPLCQVKQLSSIPGFIKCLDSDIAIAGTQAEADAIKTYMANGFYYE